MAEALEGSLAEMLTWLAPRLPLDNAVPAWPPDVFALCAELIRASGAYVRVVELRPAGVAPLLDMDWLETRLGAAPHRTEPDAHAGTAWAATARTLGRAWRESLAAVMHPTNGPPDEFRPPEPIQQAWALLAEGGEIRVTELRPGASLKEEQRALATDIVRALVLLVAVADEACVGIGLQREGQDNFIRFSDFWLHKYKRGESLCQRISRSKLRVLPKQHTPQRGMTLRSLTHNLALLPRTDVRCVWLPPASGGRQAAARLERINLLLLPWPSRVSARDFDMHIGGEGMLPSIAPPFASSNTRGSPVPLAAMVAWSSFEPT